MPADIIRFPKPPVPAVLALAMLCLLLMPGAAGADARTADGSADRGNRPARVLILHHAPEPPPDAAVMEDLLAHFRVTTRTAHASALDGGPPDAADFIILIDTIGSGTAAGLAGGPNVPHLVLMPGAADDAPAGILIRYRNEVYATTAVPAARVEAGADGEVIAWLSDGRDERPLIVRDGDRWLVATGLANELVRWLVADMLHDVLGEWHPEGAFGLLVIGNINPLGDPEHLRRLADLLGEHRLPFAAAVEPVRRAAIPTERAALTGNPKLADALRHMTEAGGTIVLDGSRLDPRDPDESARRIAQDIAVLQGIGGFPAALYASDALIESLALASERVRFSSVIAYSNFRTDGTRYSDLPYTRLRGADGTAYPESVGAAGGDAAAGPLSARMDRLRIVRDAMITVGLDAALPYETAAGLVERIAREPVMWTDLRYTAWRVETGFLRLSARGDGTMDAVVLDRDRLRELQRAGKRTFRFESITYYSSWTLVLVVAGFVVLFILFIIIMQMRRNRRLFMERELE